MATAIREPLPDTQGFLHLSREDFHALTGKLNGAYHRIDEALAHTLEMAGDMVRVASKNGLQPESGQLLFDDLSACLGTMVQTRKSLVKAHRRAHVIRLRTTQAMEGCPPPHVEALDKVVPLSSVA